MASSAPELPDVAGPNHGDSSKANPDGGRFAPGVGIASGYNDVGGELDKLEYAAG